MARRLFAECLGALLLCAAVIGSGIMAERLAVGNAAVALLANTCATVAMLAVLIALLAPVSGAHLNPAVSLAKAVRGELGTGQAGAYVAAQTIGCVCGTMLAHAMFELPLVQSATQVRAGPAQWLSEMIATAGLIWIVLNTPTTRAVAWRVPAWIGAAYWFTASTSFANPAITAGRALSDTFTGIRPIDAPAFVGAQLLGAALGLLLAKLLAAKERGAITSPAAAPGLPRRDASCAGEHRR